MQIPDNGPVWPTDEAELVRVQQEVAAVSGPLWAPATRASLTGGCWVCFPRGLTGPGDAGDPAWAAAVVLRTHRLLDQRVATGATVARYVPGLLALRVGEVMERAVRALTTVPDVLLVDATARDHPRGAGLALHLGAVLDVPTVGVTHRPLLAEGAWPADERGATTPVRLGGATVGCWLRTQPGVRPLVVHPGWRTDLGTAVALVLDTTAVHRTPEPLRQARHRARLARLRAAAEPGPSAS